MHISYLSLNSNLDLLVKIKKEVKEETGNTKKEIIEDLTYMELSNLFNNDILEKFMPVLYEELVQLGKQDSDKDIIVYNDKKIDSIVEEIINKNSDIYTEKELMDKTLIVKSRQDFNVGSIDVILKEENFYLLESDFEYSLDNLMSIVGIINISTGYADINLELVPYIKNNTLTFKRNYAYNIMEAKKELLNRVYSNVSIKWNKIMEENLNNVREYMQKLR